MNTLSRQEFLQRSTMAAAALLVSSLEGFALSTPQKKDQSSAYRLRQRIGSVSPASFKIALCGTRKRLRYHI